MRNLGEQIISSPEEPVKQLRGIFCDQIACALRDLEEDRSGRQPNVHAARKQLKKARATLRVLRASLGEEVYRRENEAVRDAARPLSGVRDSEVLLATFDALLDRYPKEFESEHIERVRRAIKTHRRELADDASVLKSITTIRRSLAETRRRASRWFLKSADWATLLGGLKRTYRRGRSGMRASQSDPTTEVLHDWRKQAKYLWHQLQMFTPIASGEIGALADQFHRLSTYLGDEHDLAVLEQKLPEFKVPQGSEISIALTSAIERRRNELRAKAFALGEQLYEHTASHFENRLDQLWEDWRKENSPRERGPVGDRKRA